MSSLPSVLIVGTGAMASLFAARISAAGIPVIMLGTWPEGVAAIKKSGVTIIEEGIERNFPVKVVTHPSDCVGVKLALVLVKSWQTERAARQLKDCLSREGRVLSLQNGLGNHQKLAASLGAERVFLGINTYGGTLLGPGLVRSGGDGLISVEAAPQLQTFVEIFVESGFNVRKSPDLKSLIWGKLAVNAAINPLTAIFDVPNGALLAQSQTRTLMALAAQEVEAVANAQDIRLPFDDVVEAVEDVAWRTSNNHSSMLQDIRRGAPTEIDAINGAIVQAADRIGVAAPVNRTLWLLVKSMVSMKSRSE